MANIAGSMAQTPPGNPQWVACNRKPYYALDATQPQRTRIPGTPSTGTRQDYIQRWMARTAPKFLGPLGWTASGFPYRLSAYFSSSELADDNTETALTPPVPWPGKPPAGIR